MRKWVSEDGPCARRTLRGRSAGRAPAARGCAARLALGATVVALVGGSLLAAGPQPVPSTLNPPRSDSPAAVPAGRSARGSVSPAVSPDQQDPKARALIEEAFEVVRFLMKEFPRSTDPIALMGNLCNQFERTEEAVRWWKKCLEREPGRADVYVGLGSMALRTGDSAAAVKHYEKALELSPRLQGVRARYAEALMAQGRFRDAVAALEAEIRLNPRFGGAYLLLGRAYAALGELEKAAEALRTAARLLPGESRVLYTLASVYARMGEAEKAIECRRRFKELREAEDRLHNWRRRAVRGMAERPTRVLAWTLAHAAVIYAAHGRLHKAEALRLRAARLDPENITCRENLVEMYLRTGRPEKAVPFCRELVRLKPWSATHHLNAGVVLAQSGRLDEAEAEIRKALELDPERPAILRSLVRLLLVRGKTPTEAAALAERLVGREPSAENYALLAETRLRAGDRTGARTALDRARTIDPRNAEVRRASRLLEIP